MKQFSVNLKGLEEKWTDEPGEPPICAVCGKAIGDTVHADDCPVCDLMGDGSDGEYAECDCGADESPVILWSYKDDKLAYLTFHVECVGGRLVVVEGKEGRRGK